jgi:hypothetical protein
MRQNRGHYLKCRHFFQFVIRLTQSSTLYFTRTGSQDRLPTRSTTTLQTAI